VSDERTTTVEGEGAATPPRAETEAEVETETEASAHGGGDELARARAEAAQYLDDLKRLKAEFENFRKRMVKQQTQLVGSASAQIVEKLLPVLDNFELALMAADRTKDYEAMVRGVELVYAELLSVLEREGLKRIDATGDEFDPEQHEAVMQEEGDGDKVIVADEIRKGYTLGGRVLRPAMVKVRKQ
jgi:molecular chaperone GrpE